MKVKELISFYTAPHILWRWILILVLFTIFSFLILVFFPSYSEAIRYAGMIGGMFIGFFVLIPFLKEPIAEKNQKTLKEFFAIYTQPHIYWRLIAIFVVSVFIAGYSKAKISDPILGEIIFGLFIGLNTGIAIVLPYLKDEAFQKKK